MAPETEVLTYGNWRKPASPGIWGLGAFGTGVMIGGAILALAAMYASGILAALAVAAVDAVLVLLLRSHDRHGRTLADRIVVRTRWRVETLRGTHRHHGGPLGKTGAFRLPGLAATTRLLEAADVHGERFAVIRLRNRYTAVLTAEPDGASLVDREQIDSWVAHWGAWLASLADEPGIVAVAVTIETSPDSGTRLRREVATNLDPGAPAVARAMLDEVVASYPLGSATVRAFVSLTFTAQRRANTVNQGLRGVLRETWDATLGARNARVRDEEDMIRDLGQRLPALAHGLQATGAGAARPVSPHVLCETVRCAYDPHAQDVFDAARAVGERAELGWDDVGPAGTEASWDSYRHDGAWSVTWSMSHAPRGEVHARVLEALLQPHPDIDRKRVTMLFKPIDSGNAARIVEHDQHTVAFLLGDAKRPSQRLLHEQTMAQSNAVDEARGAGLVNFALLLTATVTDHDRLEAARFAVEPLAARARITLRVETGAQEAAFTQALPIGVVR